MDTQKEVLKVLDDVLGLKGRSSRMTRDTPLLGAVPELDSMAVVTVLTTFEERFGVIIADDEIDASHFQTVGALTDFIGGKLKQ